MRGRTRSLFVTVVTSVLVLTGCAAGDPVLLEDGVSVGVEGRDDLALGDTDRIEGDDLGDIDRGALLAEDDEEPTDVIYAAAVADQCKAAMQRDPSAAQVRADLAGEGSLVVTYDEAGDRLLGVDLLTDPDTPVAAWDEAGTAVWDLQDGVLLGDASVDGPDADGQPDHVLRFVIDWEDVEACADDEPVTEFGGGESHLSLPGATLDAVDVCGPDAGGIWTMVLEDGTVLTVADEAGGAVTLRRPAGDADVETGALTGIADDDGPLAGEITFVDPDSGESVEASFVIDRSAAASCEGA